MAAIASSNQQEEVIFYDLATKDGRCFSPNPWKTRALLNFKGIPYRTVFLEYPDVAANHAALGIPPNEGFPAYSSPAVTIPGRGSLQESLPIAQALDAAYGATHGPPLHLDSPILPKVSELTTGIMFATVAAWAPRIPANNLNPASVDYWVGTRPRIFGMTVDELDRTRGGRTEQPFDEAAPTIAELAALLKRGQDGDNKAAGGEGGKGPFFLGDVPSYADLFAAALIKGLEIIEPELVPKVFARDVDGALARMYEACGPWLARDSH